MNYKYLIKRLAAFFIDASIVYLLIFCITNIKYLNPVYDKQSADTKEYLALTMDYATSTVYFQNYYEDKEISEEEYTKLIKDNQNFSYLFVDAYSDSKIDEEEYENILNKVDEIYKEKQPTVYYNYQRSAWYTYLVYIIIYLLYFVGFNIITKGQTLGKKLMNLEITTINNTTPNAIQYLIRSVIVYNIGIYFLNLITPFIVGPEKILEVSNIIMIIEWVIEFAVVLSTLLNKENRGIHDYLAKTKVEFIK